MKHIFVGKILNNIVRAPLHVHTCPILVHNNNLTFGYINFAAYFPNIPNDTSVACSTFLLTLLNIIR